MATELEELKLKAKELGISFSPNIGAEALRKKIEAVEIKPIEAEPVSDKQKQQARLRVSLHVFPLCVCACVCVRVCVCVCVCVCICLCPSFPFF